MATGLQIFLKKNKKFQKKNRVFRFHFFEIFFAFFKIGLFCILKKFFVHSCGNNSPDPSRTPDLIEACVQFSLRFACVGNILLGFESWCRIVAVFCIFWWKMLQIFFRKVATLALHFGVSILSWLRCIVAMVLRCFCHGFFIGLLKKHFRFVLIWVTQYQLIWVTRFQLIRVTFFYISLSCRFLCLGVSIFCMFFFSKCYIARGRLDFILNFVLDL